MSCRSQTQRRDVQRRHVELVSAPIDLVDPSTSTGPSQELTSLPLCEHVWFCWPLRELHGNRAEGIICVTDHTSRRALGTSVGMMMMVGKAAPDDAQAILELMLRGMRRPMVEDMGLADPVPFHVWGKPRRPSCIVIDGLLASCLDELRSHLAILGITVLQGRSAAGAAHSAQLHACRGTMFPA